MECVDHINGILLVLHRREYLQLCVDIAQALMHVEIAKIVGNT